MAQRLHVLTTPTAKNSQSRLIFWFSLSLSFAFIYSIMALKQAFSSEYVVQDDVRQHVFWMQRFLDPELFSNDLIANYFQSVAPAGYTAVYQAIASLEIEPLLLSKLLPLVLGLITTVYCFGVCLELLPVPAAGFISTLLLNQSLWMKDDLVSATPRAFVYPIFLAFIYYLLRRSLLPTCIAIALLGLFYPQALLVATIILILQLLHWQRGLPRLSSDRRDRLIFFSGLGVATLTILFFALKTSNFGPTITAAEAKQLPEFLPKGRSAFFTNNLWDYWIGGSRSGFFPSFNPPMLALGFFLPVILKFRAPLTNKITSKINILTQMLLASILMFFAAHAWLFKLHLPGRYSAYNMRIILALASGIVFIAIWEKLWLYRHRIPPIVIIAILGITLLSPSFGKRFPYTNYIVGNFPTLYEYFQQQPKDSLIASLAVEVNNLPTFARRSILVGSEYAIPYQIGYYSQFRQRTIDLIEAQYTPEIRKVEEFVQKYGIDFWLLDKAAFTPKYLAENNKRKNKPWLRQYQPVTDLALQRLQNGVVPALAKLKSDCTVFETGELIVLKADCIVMSSY